ncbi:MAG: glutamate racemase [Lachnospiraceae bacterium]|nr:glutamate racemase [Lachnospiraceae bacterium]
MDAPIGIFDSGVGGLTVTREIVRQLPYENLIYFGDTARVPYGTKSKDAVIRFSEQICRFLKTKNVKAIVIACNTASALALDVLQKEFDVPILGVVEPGALTANMATRNNRIGVICTRATVKSRIYEQYLHELDPDNVVFTKACPLFVPLVEEGMIEDRVTDDMIRRYLSEFHQYEIDTIVLGCTHYPLLYSPIKRFVGQHVKLVNPAFETAKSLKSLLEEHDMLRKSKEAPRYEYYASDINDSFVSFANNVLSHHVKEVQNIDIEKY